MRGRERETNFELLVKIFHPRIFQIYFIRENKEEKDDDDNDNNDDDDDGE